MSILVLGPDEGEAIAALIRKAEASPVRMANLEERLKRPALRAVHMQQMTEQSIPIPHGYFVTYSIEDEHPAGRCRHISISVGQPDMLPSPEAVWMIAQRFGFRGDMRACIAWIEELSQGDAINLVQTVPS